ncbi:MAG: hypothetical protein ACYTGQ_14895 [Planctomycetota bacterium]|jgi:hypothetical protein
MKTPDKAFICQLTDYQGRLIGYLVALIDNWGEPLSRTLWCSVRNLNGAIVELVVRSVTLKQDEIKGLYEKGKPLGY